MTVAHHLNARSLRATPIATAFAVITAAVVFLWLVFGWGGEHASTVMDDAAQVLAPAFAVLGCGVAARRSHGRSRFAWMMLGFSAGTWGMGSAVWFYYEVLLAHPVPYPSLADAGYLGSVPMAAVALLAFFPKGEATVRRFLDALLVAGALIELSWVTVISPLYASQSGGSLLEQVLGLAYPVCDVILLTLAISLAGLARGRIRVAVALLCAGIFANAVADSLFTYLTTINVYGTVNAMDVLWVAGYYAIGVAGIVRPGRLEHHADRRIGIASAFLPYGLVVVALVIAGIGELSGPGSHPVTLWDGAGILAVLLLRQGVVLRENMHLSDRLEQRVAERTRELAARTRELAARESRFRSLVQRSTDSTSVIDGRGIITYQSPAVEQLVGYKPDSVIGH